MLGCNRFYSLFFSRARIVNANAVRRSQLHPQVAMGVQVGVRVFAQVYQEVAHSAKKGGGQGAKDAMNQGASAVRTKLSQQMALEVRVCGQTQRLHPPLIEDSSP
jgi:hypothetical protein